MKFGVYRYRGCLAKLAIRVGQGFNWPVKGNTESRGWGVTNFRGKRNFFGPESPHLEADRAEKRCEVYPHWLNICTISISFTHETIKVDQWWWDNSQSHIWECRRPIVSKSGDFGKLKSSGLTIADEIHWRNGGGFRCCLPQCRCIPEKSPS